MHRDYILGDPEKVYLDTGEKFRRKKRAAYEYIQGLESDEVRTVLGRRVQVRSHREARSALSQQVQAAEVALIAPIYDLALELRERRSERTYEPFKITLYIFDGVAVQYRDKNRIERWEERILDAVAKKAAELDIPTVLERELAT